MKTRFHFIILAFTVYAWATHTAWAFDPSPLQDFCVAVADPKDRLFVNGRFCKKPELVKADDFFFSGLHIPAHTYNAFGANVTTVFLQNVPGLNTLGVSILRIDYAPYGTSPPHIHPRASQILMVAEGTLYVGFVSSNADGNRFFTKILHKGDVFVFPKGMIHFQYNIGNTPAVAFASFGSQNPGIITIADAVLGSNPPIMPEALAKAFMLDKDVIKQLQKRFGA